MKDFLVVLMVSTILIFVVGMAAFLIYQGIA